MPEHHVKIFRYNALIAFVFVYILNILPLLEIFSFEKSLLVMMSIRKPKRLKIRGSDEREWPFLVKGGEDLRLDQRVQQLFEVMNQILATDAAAAKRKLSIHTYQERNVCIFWLEYHLIIALPYRLFQ